MRRLELIPFLIILFFAVRIEAKDHPSGVWTLDPQRSSVEFAVVKLGKGNVEGRFRRFEGQIVYDAANVERSSMRWSVHVRSIETGKRGRNTSLLSSDYFDADRYPELRFESRRMQRLPDGRIRVEGTITIRGRSRPLAITARPISTDPSAPVFETRFVLDRFDFGVSGGRVVVSREVRVHLVAAGRPANRTERTTNRRMRN